MVIMVNKTNEILYDDKVEFSIKLIEGHITCGDTNIVLWLIVVALIDFPKFNFRPREEAEK